MTRPNEHHDTITSGLRIVAERPNGDGTYSPVDDPDATSPGGTISIIAKDRDGNAVLVTNAHVITGLRNSQPAGGDRVYHHEISGSRHIATVPQWDILRPAWVHRKGGLEGDGNNRMDVGYAVLESGVGVKFALHGHDDQHLPGETINVHTDRRIVPGTYDPSIGDKLVFLGRNSGEHKVTVTGLNSRQEVTGFRYIGLVSFSSTVDLIGGDSGAGLYRKVGDEYQLSCIFFTASNDRRTGYAFRASEAAEALGLTFGNRPPIAHAGPNRVINSNNPVILEGSVDDPDSADRNYVTQNHTWTQDSGPVTITLDPVADEPVHRTFTPEVVGVYFFTLTATDQEPLSASDTVRVSVWPSAQSVLPTRVRATAAARSVALGWTGPSIATGYEVEIGIPASAGGLGHTSHTTTGTTITIENLTPQQTYEYRVRMTNSDGVGPWTDWATVVTPGETPPKPTGDQWDVQYLNNKIQVKLTELPAVIPAITQVQAFLGTGLEPDLTTVEKEVGTTLNQWVDVLESSETDWRTGRWLAQIRFVNTSSSLYSIGKPVTVPNHPPVAKPGINRVVPVHTPPSLTPAVTLLGAAEDPDAGHVGDMRYSWRVDSAPGSSARSATTGPTVALSDANVARPTFTPTAIGDYVFTLTVRDPGDLTHSASVTIHACPANETSDWFDTGETRCHNNALQKRQTRRLSSGVIEFQWIDDPDNEVWGAWQDTSASHRNEEPGDWINRGGPSGFYNVSFQSQRRTVAYEKQQRRTSACGNTEERWIAASRRESRTKLAGRTLSRPRTPIDSQWEVRRMNNQIQVKVTSLPTVYDAIIEIRARLESGSGSDSVTVIKAIGTTLNSWVTVLDNTDDRWSEGEWTAKIRFENDEKNSNYSATKPVTVPRPPVRWVDTNPLQIRGCGPTREKQQVNANNTSETRWVAAPEDLVWGELENDGEATEVTTAWEDQGSPSLFGGVCKQLQRRTATTTQNKRERNQCGGYRPAEPVVIERTDYQRVTIAETWGNWRDTGNTREHPVELIIEKEQERFSSPCNRRETRWVACAWEDVSPPETRNRVTGNWTDTGNQRENQVLLIMEKEQTRTITWEKRQERTSQSGNRTESRWVDASRTETQWVPGIIWEDVVPPVTRNRVEGSWSDTDETRWVATERIFERKQTRVVTWEKKQRNANNHSQTRWVRTSTTQTQWVEIIEVCGSWSDTGQTRVDRYGSWSGVVLDEPAAPVQIRSARSGALYTGRSNRVAPPTLPTTTPDIGG